MSKDLDVVKVRTSDGVIVPIPLKAARFSILVNNMIDDASDSINDEEIPLPNVTSKTLSKVVQWCEYHIDHPVSVITKPLKMGGCLTDNGVSDWDNKFVDLPEEELFDVMLAANFMDIKPLLELCCASVASSIKSKTVEELRQELGVGEDGFTAEEEEKILRDNAHWCKEAAEMLQEIEKEKALAAASTGGDQKTSNEDQN
ncbi:sulfur metabolism negative regulator, putative [Perkinsus marinus ATCC 50983]|uniref:Sulfur metabolism negative regulator, putative n=1 Tax=Perkinsus marinus (strain ATCC 50983 / TXsc) TaxID=423536 RepID=C5L7R2_PERM5|nr:sulfur metabolism negative regulator, putative [Perkinsus marinus ATCC 50983]EER07524.1 sulfur metabolism negative regulator, putative [Perkinsus marinus ATCC 50983]|eukprot:XP_002775708.1 sulfur metabolism negative regulator, putative [Perkinsus marinus ATCC 50983]